jgi:putative ATP-dependent endonuclease of the OLD family
MSHYDWTLLGKIRKTFNQRCEGIANQLNSKFEDIVALLDQVEGFSDFKKDFATFFTEMQAETPLKMAVDFKPFTPNNYFKTMQILASDPRQGQEAFDLEELGEGSRNLILLALLRSYAVNLRQAGEEPNGILALEEPEIYMHPQAQRNLFRVLREIADSGIQVIISSHSSCFVETEYFDSIGLVRKIPDSESAQRQHSELTMVTKERLVERCAKTGVSANKTSVANIGEYYKTTSNYRLNEAFFARFVILVEGETEELALPEYLHAAGLDCDMRGVSVIAVEGKNQLPKYWRLFGAFKIPMLMLFDNDDDDEGGKKRLSNKNLCDCFNLKLMQILHSSEWVELETGNQPVTPIISLKRDFETALNADYARGLEAGQPTLAQVISEGKQVIKPVSDSQAKGLIARYVARKIQTIKPGYCPEFLRRVSTIVNTKLGFTAPA